jgi:Domain of unknown function (DUF4129)
MNLEQVTVEIRPRQAWEAVDLGLLMARRWWLPMMKVWLIISLPLLALTLLIPPEYLWVGSIILWWLKPILERPLLHILSHAVFNDLPNTNDTLKAFPSLAKKQWFMSLTLRRFSPSRSMDLPVIQLENLAGTTRKQRLDTLHRADSSAAGWLTIIGVHLETLIGLGLFGFVWAMVPSEIEIDWAGFFLDTKDTTVDYLAQLATYVGMTLVAPFYVASGFALYLNRRIQLEAWDLDIAFKRMLAKRQTPRESFSNNISSAFICAVLCLGLINSMLPTAAIAEETVSEVVEPNKAEAKMAIEHIMQQREFQRKEKTHTLKWKERDEPLDESSFLYDLFNFLANLKDALTLAKWIEWLLWILVFSFIGFVIYRYRYWLSLQLTGVSRTSVSLNPRQQLFGMDISKESLPDDVRTTSLALLAKGDIRAAIALLYRACLAHLIDQGLDIHSGHTEQECVQLMQTHFGFDTAHEKPIAYFQQLTRIWQRLAYGHIIPDQDKVQQLCEGWNTDWLNTQLGNE